MVTVRVLRACWVAAATALILVATPSYAAQPSAEELARASTTKRELLTSRIAALTGEIESGTLEGKELADAYRLRGIAYSQLSEDERAVRDFTSAIELEQVAVEYYADRAITYLRLRELKKANTDLDMALGRLIERMKSLDGLWITTVGEVARYTASLKLAPRTCPQPVLPADAHWIARPD